MDRLKIYFTMLKARLDGRKYRRSKESTCAICTKKFANIEEMEKHRRDIHPDMRPREAGR